MIQIHVIKRKLAEEQQHKHKSIHKVRVSSLTQLERKVIVLFGNDQYADKTIPSLENAVTGVEAIGKRYSGTFTKEQKLDRSSPGIKSDDILEPVADEGRGDRDRSIFAWFLMQALQNMDWAIGKWASMFLNKRNMMLGRFPPSFLTWNDSLCRICEDGNYLFEFRQL